MQIYIIEINDLKEYEIFVRNNAEIISSSFLFEQGSSVSRLMYLACAYILKKKYGFSSPINLLKNKNGKPFLDQTDIYLSFSHTATHIAFGINNTPLGIDMEKIRKLPKPLFRYFEMNYRNALVGKNEAINQMIYWTTIEAFAKVIQVCVYDILQELKVAGKLIQYEDQTNTISSFLISENTVLSALELINSDPVIKIYKIQPGEIKSELAIHPFTPIKI
jgi:phosphopantetheinyl transferase